MLAYLLDSGSAPVAVLVPLSAWAVYVAGLLKGYGPIDAVDAGMRVFVQAIPYNFYGWLAVAIAGAAAFELMPDIGPMRAAERRARLEGKLVRDGGTPLTGEELDQIRPREGARPGVDASVLATVGALVGGGLWGDHCSPVSDTSCLSSFGAGSDHMDHVTTQLPYALAGGILAAALFAQRVN
jgi:Na+/H+ antiporter NhaC